MPINGFLKTYFPFLSVPFAAAVDPDVIESDGTTAFVRPFSDLYTSGTLPFSVGKYPTLKV